MAYEQKYHYGFLIDLDLAIQLSGDNVAACGAPERKGTYEFLSINALKWLDVTFHHCYYDDMQSFFWVLLYACHRDPPRSKIIQAWSSPGQLACLTKCWLATSADMFEDLLREMRDVCQ